MFRSCAEAVPLLWLKCLVVLSRCRFVFFGVLKDGVYTNLVQVLYKSLYTINNYLFSLLSSFFYTPCTPLITMITRFNTNLLLFNAGVN